MEQIKVEEHFDEIAQQYDYWKKKNWFYYETLQSVARSNTLEAKSVLDAGCGTGTILSALNVSKKVGVDISGHMIEIARKNHAQSGMIFVKGDIAQMDVGQFDAVIFFDVIEHVERHNLILSGLAGAVSSNGVVIISMANPLWEWILILAEKMKMKMPEGPHYRISAKSLISIANEQGLVLKKREWRLLLPKYIPFITFFVNDIIGRIPIVERLACVEVFVFTKN